jgi:hypothetical protein
MNTLHSGTIELILFDLDQAIKHRDSPDVVEANVNRAKTRLLRASLADVKVEADQRGIAA